jgi:hypothetical protein
MEITEYKERENATTTTTRIKAKLQLIYKRGRKKTKKEMAGIGSEKPQGGESLRLDRNPLK